MRHWKSSTYITRSSIASFWHIAPTTLSLATVWIACLSLPALAKPNAEEALALLKAGNQRFVDGAPMRPHLNLKRAQEAAKADQADFAYATVLSCSDSRVPVEALFDAGIMDIFVVRVAGNVCDTDEAGSIEYGVGHVKTPVLVVLGHSRCGAVTAVTHALEGKGHELETNIVPLIANVEPAVKRAHEAHPELEGDALVTGAIEENVWQSIQDLFAKSASLREQSKSGSVRVVGAIYSLETGKVSWLPEDKVAPMRDAAESAAGVEPSHEGQDASTATSKPH